MGKHWRYFLFLLWFAYLIVIAILLFTRGFLLSRITQAYNASCIAYSGTECNLRTNNSTNKHCDVTSSVLKNLNNASSTCLPARAKVILIVIDALRYDFTQFDESNPQPLPFQNKLPIINHLQKDFPSSTRLYKFIADPPTTTMQRLKALTTGSLPTFIDAGSNFATAEINEDNVIDQLLTQNRNIVFLGDDTWVSLYPNRFIRSYPFPSFNVFDLDTVDDGILKNLNYELRQKDWQLLIGHFLGVDHCGHRYGPTHPEMTRKLTEMNNVIQNIVESLDENTILFVIGDHGMTNTGDHGGDSDNEVTSAMFVHSKSDLISLDPNEEDAVKQVDIIPTLSTILGIPIPYSNLGSLVINSVPVKVKNEHSVPDWHPVLFALWSNVQQMTEYIKKYSVTSEIFKPDRLQTMYEKFGTLQTQIHTIHHEDDFKSFVKDAKAYMVLLRRMCEEVWVQFDSFLMSRGLVLIFVTISLVYMIINGIPIKQFPAIFGSSFLPCSFIAILTAACISGVCFYTELVENLLSTIMFSTGMMSILMLAILVVQNWESIAIHWYDLSKRRTVIDLVFRISFLFSWCGLLSNSYIVEEGYVVLFLLITTTFLIILDSNNPKRANTVHLKPKWSTIKLKLLFGAFVLGIIIRLSVIYWKCREEQQWCTTYNSAHQQNINKALKSQRMEYVITLVTVAVFVTATRNWLRSCGNLVGFSPTVVLLRYAPTVVVVATGGYWVLHGLPKEATFKYTGGWNVDTIALVVYAFIIVGVISIVVKPLCVYVIPHKPDVPITNQNNPVPEVFNHLKGLLDGGVDNNESNVPIVCGLATVYSASFIAVSIYICLLLILLLGDIMAPSAVLLYFASVVLLGISAISRFEKISSLGDLFEVQNTSIFAWTLLSLHFFYATGHQPTFPNISWDAAFIGTGGTFTSNYAPAALVIIHTFGANILMGATLPLLLIAPFTLCVMFPTLLRKKGDNRILRDLARGEILLYENEALAFNGVFVMSCKYVFFHAVRIFICMLAATIHCRHLMVWKIFAPKLIFEAIGIVVTLASVLLGYLLLIRINFKVNVLVAQLSNRKNR